MCGRFSLTTTGPSVAELFGVDDPDAEVLREWRARYNIAPTQRILAVRADRETGKRRAELLRWGLVPRWAKDPRAGPAPINARGETVAEKSLFKGLLARRRAIVPADGFYEWKKVGTKRLPMYIQTIDRMPFGIAALWESWKGPSETIESVTLLTTQANDLVRQIHDRMPVVLPREAYARWLDPAVTDAAELVPLLAPCPPALMRMTPVSTRVNTAAADDPDCIQPLGEQQTLE
jgi:putative SOS response-associated peptidase YedK